MFAASKTATVSGAAPDDKFNYVTMLLHGDGTNGAQNNTFLDSSTNNFSITRNGNTTQGSFSPYGSNWSNNVTSSFLQTPTSTAFAFGTGDFTLECWVFATAYPDDTYPIEIWNNTNDFLMTIRSGNLQILTNTSGSYTYTNSGLSVSLNTWTHLAITRQSGTCKMFVNGVLSGTTLANTYDFTGSSYFAYINGQGTKLAGYVSNARVVKGTAVYTASFTPSTTPLTAISGTSLLTCQSNRFVDNSTNNFTFTVSGSPSVQRFNPFGTSTAYSTSVIGGSGYFDGSGDYLTFSPSTSFAFGTGDFTIEFWMNTGGVNADGAVLDSTTNGSYWAIRFNGTTLYYQSASGIANLATPTISTLSQAVWTHVAIVRASGTTKIYANGVQVSSTADSTNYTATTTYQIAKSSDSSPYKGFFSDIRVVKGTAVYTAAFTPPTAPLTAITNTSLLTNFTNGAIFDNAMMNNLETVGNAQISTSVKKYGTGSLAFDGAGDRLVSPPTYLFDLAGDFTIECWVNFNSISGTYTGIASYADSSGWYGWQLIKNNSNIQFQFLSASAGVGTVTSSSTVTTGVWYHIAVVRSGSTITLYIDGTSRGTSTSSVSYSSANSFFRVGDERTISYPLDGYVDDLRITKGYARYTTTFTPPTAAFPNIGPT